MYSKASIPYRVALQSSVGKFLHTRFINQDGQVVSDDKISNVTEHYSNLLQNKNDYEINAYLRREWFKFEKPVLINFLNMFSMFVGVAS